MRGQMVIWLVVSNMFYGKRDYFPEHMGCHPSQLTKIFFKMVIAPPTSI